MNLQHKHVCNCCDRKRRCREHSDCQPWQIALLKADETAKAGRITHQECGCPILGPHRTGCLTIPPPLPDDPEVTRILPPSGRPSEWGNQ